MSLNLINGIFYYEHELKGIDNEALISEIIRVRNDVELIHSGSGNTYIGNQSRPHHTTVDVTHTFYEDVPMPIDIENQFKTAAASAIEGLFGENCFEMNEVWGHYIPPLGQTMVHDHGAGREIRISGVYYPHVPKNAGNLFFICDINGSRCFYELKIQPNYLYLFSSSLLHYTPRNGSGVDRVSVSANWNATPEFTEKINNDMTFDNVYWYFKGRSVNVI